MVVQGLANYASDLQTALQAESQSAQTGVSI